jgi:hypothetical protein
MTSEIPGNSLARIAGVEIISLGLQRMADASAQDPLWSVDIELKSGDGKCEALQATGGTSLAAIVDALQPIAIGPFEVSWQEQSLSNEAGGGVHQIALGVTGTTKALSGAGRGKHSDQTTAEAIAVIRGLHHAGLLTATWRANFQKALRQAAGEIVDEIVSAWPIESLDQRDRDEAESIVLQHLNRTSSAAVVTATNVPDQDRMLQLFDSSAWLYDRSGHLREECTNTNYWLAWYPGLDDDERLVSDVIASLPSVPATKIPWIVQQFENPTGWLRFRGAIDLSAHDILHVLLGRGLQDQDEAFVLGFAMGTAKRVPAWQVKLFRLVLSRLYPEPYRIPRFLLPAFQFGVEAGKATGRKDLYRENLEPCMELSVGEARERAGIESACLRHFYRQEQATIPQTIASVRLPT